MVGPAMGMHRIVDPANSEDLSLRPNAHLCHDSATSRAAGRKRI